METRCPAARVAGHLFSSSETMKTASLSLSQNSAGTIAGPNYTSRSNERTRLLLLKVHVPQFSAFGDNHHAAISAQIWVIFNGYSESDVMDRASAANWPENVTMAAMDAVRWLEDPRYPCPSEDWQSLAGSPVHFTGDLVAA